MVVWRVILDLSILQKTPLLLPVMTPGMKGAAHQSIFTRNGRFFRECPLQVIDVGLSSRWLMMQKFLHVSPSGRITLPSGKQQKFYIHHHSTVSSDCPDKYFALACFQSCSMPSMWARPTMATTFPFKLRKALTMTSFLSETSACRRKSMTQFFQHLNLEKYSTALVSKSVHSKLHQHLYP